MNSMFEQDEKNPVCGPAVETPAPKEKKKSRVLAALTKKKGWIIFGALVLVAGAFFWSRAAHKPTESKHITAKVTVGDVTKTIEGSGTIEAINQYEVTSLVNGDIVADYFEEGTKVKKGDLLYRLDSSDVSSEIEKAQSGVEKSELSHQQSQESLKNLVVTAPVSGTIVSLKVNSGDNVSNNMEVATIVDASKMRLKIPFIAEEARQLQVGQSAQVNVANSFSSLSGKVVNIGTGTTTNADAVEVAMVEISVSNPGAIQSGDRATAVVGNYACNAAGTFENAQEKKVVAKGSGEVYNLRYQEGDYIAQGAALFQISSTSTTSAARQSELSLKDSKVSLQNNYDKLEDYNIIAPIDGTVIQKNIKAGEKLDSKNSSTAMAIIADLSTLIFKIDVDELDISSIHQGQGVEVTTDALPGKTFSGRIDNVSIVGTTTNGVTSYPVKVVLDQGADSGLIPGLNVNAKIVVEQVSDVVRVPVSAVRRGNMVVVKSTSGTDTEKKGEQPQQSQQDQQGKKTQQGSTQLDIPEGYHLVRVETGLSDATFIEIKSGLMEGDEVLLPDVTISTPTNMMMHGMGDGMPQGGQARQSNGGSQGNTQTRQQGAATQSNSQTTRQQETQNSSR